MWKSSIIRPIVDCQAYVIVSLVGQDLSKAALELLNKPHVYGVSLNKQNMPCIKDFERLIKLIKARAANVIILAEVELIIHIAHQILYQHSFESKDKYHSQANVRGVIDKEVGIYEIVGKMIEICQKYHLVPRFNVHFSSGSLFDQNNKVLCRINQIFFNTLIENDQVFYCEKEFRTIFMPKKNHSTSYYDQKEDEKPKSKIKILNTNLNDASSYPVVETIDQSKLNHLNLFLNNENLDVTIMASKIGDFSNYVDLIEIPDITEDKWLDLLNYLEFNPRIEVDNKLKFLFPHSEVITNIHSRLCCGFF